MDSKTLLDEMFIALSDTYRRRLLVALLKHNPRKISGLSIPEDIHTGEKEMEDLRAIMFHNHLPRLEEAGFVRWNKVVDTVMKGPRFQEMRPFLELMHNHADELPQAGLKKGS